MKKLTFTRAMAMLASLTLTGTLAHAGTYTFTQGGYENGASIVGYFNAQDLNHDGKILSNEVSGFYAEAVGGYMHGIYFQNSRRGQVWLSYDIGSHILGDGAGEGMDAYSPVYFNWIGNANGGAVYDTLGGGSYLIGRTNELIQVTDPVAVPEPETWGMLLAGMALVSLMVRRKKSA